MKSSWNQLRNDELPAMTSSIHEQQFKKPDVKVIELATVGDEIEQHPQIKNAIDILYEEQKPCYETEVLMNFITVLLNLFRGNPTYSEKLAMAFNVLREQLKSLQEAGMNGDIYDELLKLGDNVNTIQPLRIIDHEGISKTIMNRRIVPKESVYTKVVFKYKIPSMNRPTCKQTFLKLLQTAYESYITLSRNPMCEEIEEYKYSHIEGTYLSPKPLSHADGANTTDKQAKNYESKYKNDIPNNIVHVYVPNEETNQVNPYNLPYNKKIPQNVQTTTKYQINNFPPEDSENIYVISDKKKPKQDNIQHVNLQIPNVYNVIQPPGFNEIDRPLNNNDQGHSANNLIPIQSIWEIPPTKKFKPQKNNNNIDYSLQTILNLQQHEDKIPAINNKSPLIDNNHFNKLPEIQNLYAYLPPKFNILAPNNIPETPLPNEIIQLILKFPQFKEYIVKNYRLANIKIPNSLSKNEYYEKLHQTLSALTNSNQMNAIITKPGVIELTYIVKRPKPVIYRPLYYVKYRLPYETFLKKVETLLQIKPYLKAYPVQLYNEIITLSNVSDLSPDLKYFSRDKLLQLIYNNGRLVKTQVLPYNNNYVSFNTNKEFQQANNINSDVDAREIFNLNKNLTDGHYWKMFKDFADKANNIVAGSNHLQKSYKTVKPVGYDMFYPNQQSTMNGSPVPVFLEHQLNRNNLFGKVKPSVPL